MPTKSRLISSTAIILLWFISLETSFSQTPCEGSVSLTLSPSHGFVGDTITASVSGLGGEGCIEKRVYVKESSCQGLQYCSCLLAENVGCLCTFRAPPTPYSGNEPSRQNTFTYYACVDLDDDGVYDEDLGKQSHTDLLVYSRYALLGIVTESIIIIITLGILLAVIIVVYRMSLRRR